MKRLWPFLRPDLARYGLALLAAPVSAGLTILQPWLLRETIDRGITPGDPEALAMLSGAFLLAALLSFSFEALYTMAIALAATRTIARLREAVYTKALALGQLFHDTEPTGRLLSRLTSDVEALGETLTAGAVTIVLDVMVVIGIVVAMLMLDPWLTAALFLVAPPLALAIEFIRRRLRRLFLEMRNALSELVAFAAERITGIEVVQLYCDEERALAGFDERLFRYRRTTVATNLWDAFLFALVDGTTAIAMALILWYGASPWFEGAATVGLLAAFIDAVGKLFNPIRELSNKLTILQRAGAALEKLGQLLSLDAYVVEGTRALPAQPGAIEIEDLRFAYGDGPDVLHGVSLTVRPGEVVALVGRTGSGKTTIGKLLVRTYDGYRGSIRVDGVEHREVRRDALRERISVVQQDVVLFPATVRFNLTLGAPISDERLLEAVGLAQADALVDRLGGLGGRIEHGGRNLSVGEAQLLAFARVLARDAPLVVLDEATASVDSLTEARIREATRALLERRTVLVVAHRLSTIMDADRIVVLDGGRVVECGRHHELLAAEGAYATLFHGGSQPDVAAAG